MKNDANEILRVEHVKKYFYGNKKLFQKERSVVKAVNDVSHTRRRQITNSA